VLDHAPELHLLDAYQLVKHYLGLARTYPNRPLMLVYLYWEPRSASHDVFVRHHLEIQRFAELVSDDATCAFAAQSYPEHWQELERLPHLPTWAREHLASLRRRYVVEA